MGNFQFGHPWFLLLLLIIPFLIYIKYKKKTKAKAIALPNIKAFRSRANWKGYFYPLLFWMRLAVIALLIIALARPRLADISDSVKNQKGIDIILTVDISLSMLAQDLQPDRLTALKEVAVNFVKERPVDRMGLIAYSGEAMTLVPLTNDKDILIDQIKNLKTQTLEGGTAIGVGLATAINHLKNSKAKSKIIILMTDGVNNDGFIEPQVATEIAKHFGIKVYTIGIGTNGTAPFPAGINQATGEIKFEKQAVEIDEKLLQNIANQTGGEYFRATDNQKLKETYNKINSLEKSDINQLKYYNYTEKYRPYLLAAMIILLLELLLKTFVFRSIN